MHFKCVAREKKKWSQEENQAEGDLNHMQLNFLSVTLIKMQVMSEEKAFSFFAELK